MAFYNKTVSFLREKIEGMGLSELGRPLLSIDEALPSEIEEYGLELDDAYLLVRSVQMLNSDSLESWDENYGAAKKWLELAERTLLRLGALSDEDKSTLNFLHEADVRPEPVVGGFYFPRIKTPWEERVERFQNEWRNLCGSLVGLKDKVVGHAHEIWPVICTGWDRAVSFGVRVRSETVVAASALVAVASTLLVVLTFVVDVLRGARSLWRFGCEGSVHAFRRLHRAGQLNLRFAVVTPCAFLLAGGFALASISNEIFELEPARPLELPKRPTVVEEAEPQSRPETIEATELSQDVSAAYAELHQQRFSELESVTWREIGEEEGLRAMELLVSDPRKARISRHIQLRRNGLFKHDGIDIATSSRNLIATVPDDCKVLWAGYRGSFGNVVMVAFSDGTQGVFGHLSRIDVRVGQELRRGDSVGVIGRTGRHVGGGYHLHFGLYDSSANGKIMFSSNNPSEFFGARRNDRAGVDPWPWLLARWQEGQPELRMAKGDAFEHSGL